MLVDLQPALPGTRRPGADGALCSTALASLLHAWRGRRGGGGSPRGEQLFSFFGEPILVSLVEAFKPQNLVKFSNQMRALQTTFTLLV